jgi:hypothetical protein
MLGKLALALVTALVLAAAAVAGDIGITLGFKAGTLGVKAQSTAIDGGSRVAVRVVDARGSGKGWALRIAGGGGSLTRIAMRCAAGSTCTLPSGAPALPDAIGAAPTTILAAAPGKGMGAIEIILTVAGGHGRLAVTIAPV